MDALVVGVLVAVFVFLGFGRGRAAGRGGGDGGLFFWSGLWGGCGRARGGSCGILIDQRSRTRDDDGAHDLSGLGTGASDAIALEVGGSCFDGRGRKGRRRSGCRCGRGGGLRRGGGFTFSSVREATREGGADDEKSGKRGEVLHDVFQSENMHLADKPSGCRLNPSQNLGNNPITFYRKRWRSLASDL